MGARFPEKKAERYPPDPTCVLDIPMFEGAGGVTEDRSVHKNNGAISGASWELGLDYDGCLRFNGTSDYIECGGDETLNFLDKFTVTAWCRFDVGAGTGYIISKNLLGISDAQYGIYFESAVDGTITVVNGSGRGSAAANSVVPGNSIFVCGVYNRTDVRHYVNGVLSGAVFTYTTAIAGTAYTVNIGRRKPGNIFFKGVIGGVRLYPRALSAQEILDMYERTKPPE